MALHYGIWTPIMHYAIMNPIMQIMELYNFMPNHAQNAILCLCYLKRKMIHIGREGDSSS